MKLYKNPNFVGLKVLFWKSYVGHVWAREQRLLPFTDLTDLCECLVRCFTTNGIVHFHLRRETMHVDVLEDPIRLKGEKRLNKE